jgi:hypothetical protein
MQHEIGEQGAQARGIEVGHLLVVVEQAEIAKQAEVKGWHRHDRLPFSCSYRKRANRSVARTISWAMPGVSGAWPALSTITSSARGHTRLSSHAFPMGA